MTEHPQVSRTDLSPAPPGELGWHLGMVLRGYQLRLEAAVGAMPAGIRGFQILSAVVHLDPPNQQALGTHLAIDRTVLTYLLDTLVEAGLVQRIAAPTDRRARKIEATDEGRAALSQYEEHVAAFEAELLSDLNETEAGELSSLISRLAMDIHRSQPGTSPCEVMDHLP